MKSLFAKSQFPSFKIEDVDRCDILMDKRTDRWSYTPYPVRVCGKILVY